MRPILISQNYHILLFFLNNIKITAYFFKHSLKQRLSSYILALHYSSLSCLQPSCGRIRRWNLGEACLWTQEAVATDWRIELLDGGCALGVSRTPQKTMGHNEKSQSFHFPSICPPQSVLSVCHLASFCPIRHHKSPAIQSRRSDLGQDHETGSQGRDQNQQPILPRSYKHTHRK